MAINELTLTYKVNLIILPVGSSSLMPAEYCFHFIKDVWIPKYKLNKKTFEIDIVKILNEFPRK